MARNRRSDESAATRLAPALMALLACAFFVSTGVGYVWYSNQNTQLGREIVKLENELNKLKTENSMRKDRYDAMISPFEVDNLVQKKNLGLGPPAPAQIIRIYEPPAGRATAQNPQRSAGTSGLQPEKP